MNLAALRHSFVLLACCVALGAAIAQTPAKPARAGAAAPCAQGLISGGPGTPSGRWVICSEAERLVPELAKAIEQMQRQMGAQDARTAEMQRMLRNANEASVRAGQQQMEMARALSARLDVVSAQSPTASLRSMRQLSDGFEQLVENIDIASKDESKRDAYAALVGTVQQAIASLELDKANKLMVDLLENLTTVNEESRDIAIFAEAQRTRARGDLGQARVLGVFSTRGKTFDGHDLAGIAFSGAKAPGLRAPKADLTLTLFDDADLSRAHLQGALLAATVLERAKLEGANLSEARGAFTRAQRANLSRANLSRSTWIAADLRNVDLRGANLAGASLAHSDLRGADLRGADLTNAFLGNADLRGAQLSGATLRNTDVAYALLPRDLLDARQFAALCATPFVAERSISWRVIERIPSSYYGSGYENREIISENFYLGRGGHRPYPVCQLREKAEMPPWNPPIWRHEQEQWVEGLTLWVEHPVADGARRRQEMRDTMDAARELAFARPRLLRELPQFAEIHAKQFRALDERLAMLVRTLKPPKALPMDQENMLLAIRRLRPELLTQLDLNWEQVSEAGLRGYTGASATDSRYAWPRLYPEGLLREDLSERTTQAYLSWSRARVSVAGASMFTLGVNRSRVRPGAPLSSLLVYGMSEGQAKQELAQRLAVPSRQLATFSAGWKLAGNGASSITAFVAADSELETLIAAAARDPSGNDGVLVTIEDVRLVPAGTEYGSRPALVWYIRVPSQ